MNLITLAIGLIIGALLAVSIPAVYRWVSRQKDGVEKKLHL